MVSRVESIMQGEWVPHHAWYENHPVCKRVRNASKIPRSFGGPHHKIDVLITWTNASQRSFNELFEVADERWQAWGHAPQRRHGTGRWDDHDELRFALRSVWEHLPALGVIYLLTGPGDDVVPTWLKKNPGRFRIVPHSAVFPKRTRSSVLPTFSSTAIETMLHRVPKIRTPFLFLNDDFFLGKNVQLSAFMHRGGQHGLLQRTKYHFAHWSLITTDYMNIRAAEVARNKTIGHHEASVIQAASMVEKLLGRPIFGFPNVTGRPIMAQRQRHAPWGDCLGLKTPHTLSHAPKLLHTGVFELLWELWPHELNGLILEPFRVWGAPRVTRTLPRGAQPSRRKRAALSLLRSQAGPTRCT